MPIAGQKGVSQQLSLGPLPIAELLADDQKEGSARRPVTPARLRAFLHAVLMVCNRPCGIEMVRPTERE